MADNEDKEKKKMYLTVADLSTMGFAMVLSIVLGLVAGVYLDQPIRNRSDLHLCLSLWRHHGRVQDDV